MRGPRGEEHHRSSNDSLRRFADNQPTTNSQTRKPCLAPAALSTRALLRPGYVTTKEVCGKTSNRDAPKPQWVGVTPQLHDYYRGLVYFKVNRLLNSQLPQPSSLLLFPKLIFTMVSVPNIPHLQQYGNTKQLIVNGKPFLMRGAELQNSSLSSAEFMSEVWPEMVATNINTVLGAVTWEVIEPEEGKFDFDELDKVVLGAREHGIRLILLWFGSWKNGGCFHRLMYGKWE